MTGGEAMKILAESTRTRVRKIDGTWWVFCVGPYLFVLGYPTHAQAVRRAHELMRIRG